MVVSIVDSEGEDIGSGRVQDSDDSSEHQQHSPPVLKMSKKLTGAATYRPSSTPFGYLTIEFFLKLLPSRAEDVQETHRGSYLQAKFNSVWISHYRVLFEVERSDVGLRVVSKASKFEA